MRIVLPYKDLNLFSVIDHIDIPLLFHYKDRNENNLIRYVIDIENKVVQSLIWKAKDLDLFNYLNNTITLREMVLSENKEFVYYSETDFNTINDIEVFSYEPAKIPLEFLPGKNSFYGFAIPEIYSYLVDHFASDYVVNLKERGVTLKLSPRTQKYLDTVSVENVADFTNRFTSSYESYVEQCFYKKFKDRIIEAKDYEKTKKKVLNKAKARVCDLHLGSFEITLSNDRLNSDGLSEEIVIWANNILAEYADDVLFVDYGNEEILNRLIQTVSPIELKAIYDPIISTIAQNEYFLQVRTIGTAKNIVFNRNYRQARKKIKNKIQEAIELEASHVKTKFVHVVYVMSEGEKRPRRSEMIASFESKRYDFTVLDIQRPEAKYNLIEGITFSVEITDDGKFYIEDELLPNSILIDDGNEIASAIAKEINLLIDTKYNGDMVSFFAANNIKYQ